MLLIEQNYECSFNIVSLGMVKNHIHKQKKPCGRNASRDLSGNVYGPKTVANKTQSTCRSLSYSLVKSSPIVSHTHRATGRNALFKLFSSTLESAVVAFWTLRRYCFTTLL